MQLSPEPYKYNFAKGKVSSLIARRFVSKLYMALITQFLE